MCNLPHACPTTMEKDVARMLNDTVISPNFFLAPCLMILCSIYITDTKIDYVILQSSYLLLCKPILPGKKELTVTA